MNDQQQLEYIKTEFSKSLKNGLLNLHICWLIDQAEKLQKIESLIPWKKYDPTDRSIESHIPHLVTDGKQAVIAVHAKRLDGDGYGWHRQGGYSVNGVTHWSPINLPGEETTDDIQTNQS